MEWRRYNTSVCEKEKVDKGNSGWYFLVIIQIQSGSRIKNGCLTGCIVCNPGSPVAAEAEFPVEVVVGPEFVTGSTRMKSGTAQKLVLNMVSTAVMIRLGKVVGNKMVDMQLSNEKLVERGTQMVMNETGVDYAKAKKYLLSKGSVRNAVETLQIPE